MDWIKKIVDIREKLSTHGYDETAARIVEAQMVLGTPGEIYLEVMHVLLSLKKNNADEFELIQKEVDDLMNYGREIYPGLGE